MATQGERLKGAVRVHYVFAWEKGRKQMDLDNLVALAKSALDGLVDAGIMGDDRYVVGMTAEQTRDPNGVGYLQVTVKEVAE
jgi:Holliday junction resolvase RusA-like endonuclease